jgi:hypothetical protein
MSGIPCFQQGVGFGSPDFSDHDSFWDKAHADTQTLKHGDRPDTGIEGDEVLDSALQFSCVFDNDDAVIRGTLRNFVKDGVCESGFSRTGRADNQDIFVLLYGEPNNVRVAQALHLAEEIVAIVAIIEGIGFVSEDLIFGILLERKYVSWPAPGRESWGANDWRSKRFKAAAVWKFCLKDGVGVIDDGVFDGCKRAKGTQGRAFVHLAELAERLTPFLYP